MSVLQSSTMLEDYPSPPSLEYIGHGVECMGEGVTSRVNGDELSGA